MGTFRYFSLVLDRLRNLEPQHLRHQEEQLCREVEGDLQRNSTSAKAVVDRLEAMLQVKASGLGYSQLEPPIRLMLGKAYVRLGQVKEAFHCFKRAADSGGSIDVRREALICCALTRLRCQRDEQVLETFKQSSRGEVDRARSFLERAETLTDSTTAAASLSAATAAKATSAQGHPRQPDSTLLKRTSKYVTGLLRALDDRGKTLDVLKAAADKRAEDLRVQKEAERKRLELAQLLAASSTRPSGQPSAVPQSFAATRTPVSSPDGSALHQAAARGQLLVVKSLVGDGADPFAKDSLGNTPLLCAAENGHSDVIEYLATCSLWHTVNKAQKTFLDIFLRVPVRDEIDSAVVAAIEEQARVALIDDEFPSRSWAAAKYFESCKCKPMDDLMDMIGLRTIKAEALKLFQTIRSDLQRPVEARVTPKQALNFLFLGNPGSGKTTVARLFGEILIDLGIREDKFVETSGQKLLQDGASKFPALLGTATPGVLFIDEVYLLDPNASADGKAITNTIMEATENDRDKLTVIVAGYREDVTEKWVQSNPGIASRFPIEILFEDFSESELRIIFNKEVRSRNWHLERFVLPPASHSGAATASATTSATASATSSAPVPQSVDVALVAARRLSRAANKRGFANARSVRTMVEKALRLASTRQKKEQVEALRSGVRLHPNHSITLTLPDIIGRPIDPATSPLVTELMAMTVKSNLY
jgi:tetratricopeptide (TPR) repeat protein